jgi:hypothetical protein
LEVYLTYGHLFPWQILTRSVGLAMSHRFDRQYDAEKLRVECQAILEQFHPNNQHGKDHDGGWKAVSLVAPGGDAFEDRIHGNVFAKTPALELAPYMEEIIDSFPSKPRRVRLMQLLPGENIYWHYDPDESVDRKHIRLHVPVFTHDKIRFQIGHEDCRWQAGDLWYGDFTFPHRLFNAGEPAGAPGHGFRKQPGDQDHLSGELSPGRNQAPQSPQMVPTHEPGLQRQTLWLCRIRLTPICRQQPRPRHELKIAFSAPACMG